MCLQLFKNTMIIFAHPRNFDTNFHAFLGFCAKISINNDLSLYLFINTFLRFSLANSIIDLFNPFLTDVTKRLKGEEKPQND